LSATPERTTQRPAFGADALRALAGAALVAFGFGACHIVTVVAGEAWKTASVPSSVTWVIA